MTTTDTHTPLPKESVLFQHQEAVELVLASHTPAWIFAGDEGIGKATAALHIAAQLLADEGDATESLFMPAETDTDSETDTESDTETGSETDTETDSETATETTAEGEGDSQDSLFGLPEHPPLTAAMVKKDLKIARLTKSATATTAATTADSMDDPPASDTPETMPATTPSPTSASEGGERRDLSGLEVHPDAMIIKPASGRPASGQASGIKGVGRIGIEQVREVAAFLAKTSAKGGWRVVVVDAVDDMTPNAANGMLKMLEEPPAKTTIILISHTPGAILPTIRSRCRFLRFSRLSDDHCRQVLARLYPDIDADHAETMLAFADGSPGRAVLMVETRSVELYADTCRALAAATPDLARLDQLASAWGAAGMGNRRRRRLGMLLFDRLLTQAAMAEAGRSAEETAALVRLTARYSPVYLATRHGQMLDDLRQADRLNTASQPIILRLLVDLVVA